MSRAGLGFGWAAAAWALLALCVAPAHGQTGLRAAASLQPADPPAGLNRIIIGLRPEKAQAAAAGSMRVPLDAADAVRALARNQALVTAAGDSVELSYRRSVSQRIHVALTSRRLHRADMNTIVRRLQQDPLVAFAEVDERVTAQLSPGGEPNDPEFLPRQWNLQSLAAGAGAGNFPGAWIRDTISGKAIGTGVIVAQLDGGFRPHADLSANMLPGYDFISADPSGAFTTANDGDARDNDARDPGDWSDQGDCPRSNSGWHGTHVAGVIAAVGDNNLGIAGAAFGARVLPIRVLGVCGGYVSDIAAGMRWAAGLPVPGVPANPHVAKVLNLSLGRFGNCSQVFQGAVDEVVAAGSMVIAAAGNDRARAILQPANCTGAIGVTAHTVEGDNASYANIGQGTAISAPGGGFGATVVGDGRQIYSTSNTGVTTPQADRLEFKRGTSMATAHVSAVAALMVQAKPSITPQELFSRLLNAARPHPSGSFCDGLRTCGAGLLDASASVDAVLADDAPVLAVRSSASLVAARGTHVQLLGTATRGDRGTGIQSESWSQTAGPAVALNGAHTGIASFVVPASGSSFSFRYSARDHNGKTAHLDLTVPANNSAPQMVPIGTQFVLQGQQLTLSVSATDAEGDTIDFVASTVPRGARFDAATATLVWDNAGPLGSYSVGITPSDGLLSGETLYVSIVVIAPGTGGGGTAPAAWWLMLGALAALLPWWRRWRAARTSAAHGPSETRRPGRVRE